MCLLGDRRMRNKVRGREDVTHASQGCDMPGSGPLSPHLLSASHVFVCVSRSDRILKGNGKRAKPLSPTLDVVWRARIVRRAGHRQGLMAG